MEQSLTPWDVFCVGAVISIAPSLRERPYDATIISRDLFLQCGYLSELCQRHGSATGLSLYCYDVKSVSTDCLFQRYADIYGSNECCGSGVGADGIQLGDPTGVCSYSCGNADCSGEGNLAVRLSACNRALTKHDSASTEVQSCSLSSSRSTELHNRYLDEFRGTLMLSTCVAILAVDFETFPAGFAKSETYGTSVMDVGPGGIIFAGGLVSYLSQSSSQTGRRQARCLLIIGLIRLIATTATNYQVEVGEYGRHWNFFFTLSGIAFVKSLFPSSPGRAFMMALTIVVPYQTLLQLGLSAYVHSDDHEGNWLHQNKEGVWSFFGFCCLHYFGVSCSWLLTASASFFLRRTAIKADHSSTASPKLNLVAWWLFVAATTASLFLIAHFSETVVEAVSRRACNLSYILWMCAYHMCQCLWNITIQISDVEDSSSLSRSINRNLFGIFLLANALTGIINLAMDTHEIQRPLTVHLLLSGYVSLLCFSAIWADRHSVYLKL